MAEAQGRARPTLAKIVATIGPASDSPEMIAKLIEAGASIFRLNFSHGTPDEHARRLKNIREVAIRIGQPVAVLGDLQGPKIRVGVLSEGGIELAVGQDVVFTTVPDAMFDKRLDTVRMPTEYESLASEVKPGERVLINDGAVRLMAVDRESNDTQGVLRCRVLVGGLVLSRKGINLPDSDIKAAAITEKDWRWVEWAVGQGVDLLALSFVRRAAEVIQLKRALSEMCPPSFSVDHTNKAALIPVIAKIEKPQALEDLDAIFEAADGVMVARGDLGVEMDLAQVPLIQKRLIAKSDEWGKPCIVATQMLESMIEGASPTRAEASDVANAVLDGADAVMLSGETAVGRHPALVVETMRRIVLAAEERIATLRTQPSPAARLMKSRYRTAALAHGAWFVAQDVGAKIVACWSQEGGTARYLSQTGMDVPIVAYSSSERAVRRMGLLRSVTARLIQTPPGGTLGEWNVMVEDDLRTLGWVKEGDPIVLVAGKPLGVQGATSALAVHYIGNLNSGFMNV